MELLNNSQENEDGFNVKCFGLCPGLEIMLFIQLHFTFMSAVQKSKNNSMITKGKYTYWLMTERWLMTNQQMNEWEDDWKKEKAKQLMENE